MNTARPPMRYQRHRMLLLVLSDSSSFFFFFFNDTATTEIYTLSLHDALPILPDVGVAAGVGVGVGVSPDCAAFKAVMSQPRAFPSVPADMYVEFTTRNSESRSEEHTSELQSQSNLVCRLLLEKKKKKKKK